MSVFPTSIPGMPTLPPGAPGPSAGVAGASGGTPIPGLPALPPSLTSPRFPPSSRYAGTEIVVVTDVRGRPQPCLRRRFVPQPERLGEIGRYTVQDGDRIDRIAAITLGDPEQFWRLCDGNRALSALECEAPRRVLRITLPAGIPPPPPHA